MFGLESGGLFGLESGGKQAKPIAARNYMEGHFREDQAKLFPEVKKGKTRSSSHKVVWIIY